MKIGVGLYPQNFQDWDRYLTAADTPPEVPDWQVYEEELRFGDLAEPLGFDSIWVSEHHFSPYNTTPDTLQFLTYFAGRTERLSFGTMVIVLPWHDPVGTAEKIAMLDNMLQGRRLVLGIGRGTARREFEGLRIPMEESRSRFTEALAVLRLALTQDLFSYQGKHYQISDTTVRPRPRNADLTDRMYCAWGSPETLQRNAQAGLGMLFTPQKSWEEYAADFKLYNSIRAERGSEPLPPIIQSWVYCAETEAEAWAGAVRYMGEYADCATQHYEFDEPEHFRQTKGYEHFVKRATRRVQMDPREFAEDFARHQLWGTPQQCVEKLREIKEKSGAAEYIALFRYGSMPYEEGERNLRLFAAEVLPHLSRA